MDSRPAGSQDVARPNFKMPRKRTTRLQSTKTHVKAEPSDDKGLTGKARAEQLQLILREYDSQVKNMLKEIDKKKRAMNIFIQTRYEEQISNMPSEIKDMTLEDFAKCGGTFEAAKAHMRTQVLSTADKSAKVRNMKWDPPEFMENITEEGSEDTVPVFAQPTTVKSKRNLDKTASRTATAKRNGRFMTPVSKMSQPLWGPTPLVTPKFDPNLPMTPENSREAKPGEKFMSMAGSPILVKKNRRISEAVDKKEMAQQWSGIVGMDLTPTRVEQMLKAVAEKINQK